MFINSGFNIEMFYTSMFVTTFDQLKFKLVARIKRQWKLSCSLIFLVTAHILELWNKLEVTKHWKNCVSKVIINNPS